MARYSDSFRDWNILHKAMAAFLAALAVGAVIHGVRVIDGAFELTESRVLPYSAETLWPWVVGDQNRARWQSELIDISPLVGESTELDATRLVFWQRKGRRFHGVEKTTAIVPERVFATAEESDQMRRWLRVELVPLGPCQTRVIIADTLRPHTYSERFWFFLEQGQRADRLDISFDALEGWLGKREQPCLAN